MHKKEFIALADMIKAHNRNSKDKFTEPQLIALAEFCREQNPSFLRERWLSYVAGECGPNGGSIRKAR